MSKQIDERVVSMQFDNKNFESNVKTTMSTLDKLKAKLNLSGASKGLENVGHAAKKVDMRGLSNSVDTVRSRFSALEVMGVTALANITNSAVNAGKRIVSALTIDPLRTGFQEYELKMNSVQTIMASTGESLETVNKYLEELNEYSDKTIYSFSDMTQNIGKFTNAGVSLEKSVAAIQGIANVAAVSGANANEASRAMYNFSQALSSGYVKLIDWKSIELANMATVEFKEQLIATAVEMGTLKKTSNGMYKTLEGKTISATKNFNDSLQDQWMTSEVLIKTLGNYTDETTEIGKKATEAATKVKTFTQLLDTLKESAQSGWAKTWELIFGDFNEGTNLWTRISESVGGFIEKTSKARNTMLEGAFGSKWDSFNEQIEKAGIKTEDFGEKLKEVAKEEGYAVDDLIEKHGSLNKAISNGALSKDVIVKTLRKIADGESKAAESTDNMTDKLEYFQKVVNEVWHGDYANGAARIKALEEAGYDYATVQALVNKTVDGHKLTLEDLSDVQLKNIGYTEDQIKTIRELADEAEKTGTPLNELINNLDKPSGRELLIESLANAFKGLGTVLGSVKKAWNAIFHPGMSEDEIISEKSARIYRLTEALNKFSQKLVVNEDTARLWVKTFKGVFALVDIITTLIMGPIKVAFKLFSAILEVCDVKLLEFTATISHYIVAFRNWLDSIIDFRKIAEKVVEIFHKIVNAIKNFGSATGDAGDIAKDFIQGLINGFKNGLRLIKETLIELAQKIIDTVKDVLGIHSPSTEGKEIGENFVLGIIEGIVAFAKKLYDTIAAIISSIIKGTPMAGITAGKEFIDYMISGILSGAGKLLKSIIQIGKLLLDSGIKLLSGFKTEIIPKIADGIRAIGDFLANAIPIIVSMLGDLGAAIRDAIKKIDFKAIMKEVGKGLAGAISLLFEIGRDAIMGFADGIKEGYPNVFKAIGEFIDKAKKFLEEKGIGFAEIMTGVIVTAILLSLGQVLALLGSIRGILGGIKNVINSVDQFIDQTRKLVKSASKILGGIAITMISKALINFAIAIAILVAAMMAIAFIPEDKFVRAAVTMGVLTGIVLGMMVTLTILSKSMLTAKDFDEFKEKAKAFNGVRSIFFSFGLSLLAIAGAIMMLGKLKPEELTQGAIVVAVSMAALFGIMMSTRLIGKINPKKQEHTINETAKLIGKITVSLLIIALAIKMLGKIEWYEALQGTLVAGAMLAAIAGLIYAIRWLPILVAKKQEHTINQAAKLIGKIATSLFIIALAIKILGSLDSYEATQGTIIAGLFIGAVIGLMKATTLLTKQRFKDDQRVASVGKMVSGVAMGLLLVGIAFKVFGSLSPKEIMIGSLAAIGLIGATVGLMAATKLLTKDATSATAVSKIGVMVLGICAGLLALSFAIVILGNLHESGKMWGGIAGAIALMAGVTILMAATQYLTTDENGGKNAMKVGVMILIIAAALLLMTAAIVILSKIEDQGRLWSAVGAISTLLLLVGGLMAVSKLAEGVKIGTLLGIMLIIAALATSLGILSLIDADRLIAPTIALSVVILALTVLIKALNGIKVKKGTTPMLITLGAVIVALAGVLWLLSTINFDNAWKNALLLVGFIAVLTLVAFGLSKLTKAKVTNLTKASLAILILTGILTLLVGLLWLMQILNVQDSITKALSLTILLLALTVVAKSLGTLGSGTMLKNIALGTVALVLLCIPLAALAAILGLMQMMGVENALPNALALTTLILTLTVVAVVLGLIGGMIATIALGTVAILLLEIPLLALVGILSLMKDMKASETMTNVLALSALLLVMVGIAAILAAIGALIVPIAIGTVAVLLITAILPTIGSALGKFMSNIGTFNDAQLKTVTCAVNSFVAMSEACKNIVPDSLWAFFGAGQFKKFIEQLPSMAYSIASFITNLGTFGNDQLNTVTAACNAVKNMSQAFDGVTPDSLFEFFSNNKFEKFMKALPDFAEYMNKFMEKMQTFDESTINSVNAAVGAVKAFSALKDIDVGDLKDKMSSFGDGMSSFADKIKTFATKMNEIGSESISNTANNLVLLVSACQLMRNITPETVSNFGTSLGSLGEADVKTFVTAINNALPSVVTAGEKLVNNLATGATNANEVAVGAINSVVTNAASAATSEENTNKFYNAGSSLVSGFAAGISDNIQSAANKAAAMARAAAAAAEAELDINSPSKVFRAIGTAIPEGFAMGIDKLSGMVTMSSVSMADDAVFTVTDSVSRISDMIDSGIDTQPTIRPVLDLSEIKAGAGDIDGLLGSGTSVGLLSNINAISSSMNRQNGTDDELVSEIRALRKDIGEMSSNTYNINGVTYDDGSNITEAVQTIVRAARIERRT